MTGATSYAPATRTLTFQPSSPLQAGANYTATVSGATALSGNVMSPYSWQFTTAGVASCPCSLFSSSAIPATPDAGDPGAVELGVGFTPSTDGQVTGLRFYKTTLNTGIHTGTLWSSGGSVLATGTFTGESASGWQTLAFSSPVAVTAGTTYVVSYHAPNGHYSATPGFFAQPYANGPLSAVGGNGRYAYGPGGVLPTGTYGSTNYWVDPTFRTGTPPDTAAPVVSTTAPVTGSTSQPVTSTPTATFTEDIVPSSLGFSLSTSNGSVSGAASYDSATRTARFTPTDPLGAGTTYTASVTAADAAGNAISPAHSWSFTTSLADPEPGTCPCSLWTDSTAPTTMSDPDTTSIELGTRFSADTDGFVTGVRFYKAPDNAGVHPVSLWSDAGVRLATATPTSESSTGWQSAAFATPFAVTAGTSYVVSYLAPNGRYSSLVNGLATPRDRPPLHTLASAGRYAYGSGGFPANASGASYLVDPVFTTGSGGGSDTTPPVISAVSATVSGTTATVTWTTDEAASSSVSYGTSAGSLTSTATGPSGTSHSVSITGLDSTTQYHFRVTSADAAGNSSTSPAAPAAPGTFTTPDTVAPAISAVSATVSGTTATVTWTTDEAASSSVAYGTSAASLGSTANGPTGTSHSVTITGLATGTTYSFRVTSADAAGNSSTSPAAPAAPATFATADVTAPSVTAVAATGSGTTATITWTTDEAASSSVAYGTSAGSLGSTATGPTGTSHTVTLTGLAPNTRYYLRVTSSRRVGQQHHLARRGQRPGRLHAAGPALRQDDRSPTSRPEPGATWPTTPVARSSPPRSRATSSAGRACRRGCRARCSPPAAPRRSPEARRPSTVRRSPAPPAAPPPTWSRRPA